MFRKRAFFPYPLPRKNSHGYGKSTTKIDFPYSFNINSTLGDGILISGKTTSSQTTLHSLHLCFFHSVSLLLLSPKSLLTFRGPTLVRRILSEIPYQGISRSHFVCVRSDLLRSKSCTNNYIKNTLTTFWVIRVFLVRIAGLEPVPYC